MKLHSPLWLESVGSHQRERVRRRTRLALWMGATLVAVNVALFIYAVMEFLRWRAGR